MYKFAKDNITSLERKILKGYWSQNYKLVKSQNYKLVNLKLNAYLHWRYRPKRDEPVGGHHRMGPLMLVRHFYCLNKLQFQHCIMI